MNNQFLLASWLKWNIFGHRRGSSVLHFLLEEALLVMMIWSTCMFSYILIACQSRRAYLFSEQRKYFSSPSNRAAAAAAASIIIGTENPDIRVEAHSSFSIFAFTLPGFSLFFFFFFFFFNQLHLWLPGLLEKTRLKGSFQSHPTAKTLEIIKFKSHSN